MDKLLFRKYERRKTQTAKQLLRIRIWVTNNLRNCLTTLTVDTPLREHQCHAACEVPLRYPKSPSSRDRADREDEFPASLQTDLHPGNFSNDIKYDLFDFFLIHISVQITFNLAGKIFQDKNGIDSEHPK